MFLADKTYKWSSITLIPKIFSGEKFYAHDFVLCVPGISMQSEAKISRKKQSGPGLLILKFTLDF